MAKKVLCSSHVPWIPDRPSSGSLVMLTAIGCASSKVNCLASTASRRRDLRRTRGDQRVHCASMLKVDASDLALTREALYRTLSLERAASGHAAALPSAASNSRRPMVTVIRPSRARCVKGRVARRERAVPDSAAPGRAVGRALINAGIGRMSALGANRTCRDGRNDVNDPGCASTLELSNMSLEVRPEHRHLIPEVAMRTRRT